MKGTVFADYGLGLDHWDDRCTNGFYYGHAGDIPGTEALPSAAPMQPPTVHFHGLPATACVAPSRQPWHWK